MKIGMLRPLRIWTQKILPLVYDDSLSYYEVLSRVIAKVNQIIDYVTDNVEALVSEVVMEYFLRITYTESTQTINLIVEDGEDNA